MLNLDTYFNSFSASKWYKYTIVNKVKIRLFLVGTVRISLIYKEKTTTGINEKVIKETYFDSDEEGEHLILSLYLKIRMECIVLIF